MNSATVVEKTLKELPILFQNKNECCGCTACYSICPVGAIIMKPDEEGFLYPTVTEEKCIRCYKCLSVCDFKDRQASWFSKNGDKK